MQTRLPQTLRNSAEGTEAEAILRKCVHCGFCNATCPTYQLLGDELDGPRGRIYLIKQMLEGHEATAQTQLHLDRCLICRNCETTCPSGVQFGRLLETGRTLLAQRHPRPMFVQMARRALASFLQEGSLFRPLLRVGQLLQPALPAAVAERIPARRTGRGAWPSAEHARKVILLQGCVQPTLSPNINLATVRVLDKAGIQTVIAQNAGCCGAIRQHLDFASASLDDARRNIDAWWPLIEQGAEALVSNASGCGVALKEYGHRLRNDPQYAAKAERVSALAKDIVEVLADCTSVLAGHLHHPAPARIAWHPPCTLQHGQQLGGKVEAFLGALGVAVMLPADAHLCCGSAGTYSLLQPEISNALRERKCRALTQTGPDCIVSANIGCITHLQSGTGIPVIHWIELIDRMLVGTPA